MKEIVSVQVGSYANFVGSHFWNFQDELLGLADSTESDQIFKSHGLDMDVLYRTGETQQGILTYTPRLVSVDFQGSLGSVSSRGTLYNEVPDASVDTLTWTGPLTTHTSQPLKKNLFLQSLYMEENANASSSRVYDSGNSDSCTEIQDKDIVDHLENGVQYWTDFSKVQYHPQSLYELSGLWTDVQDFNTYGIGREVFSGGGHAEEINERLRFFVEECDLPQGIQFIVDDSGGFSGVAGEFLENIADEYPNIPLLLYCVRSPDSYLDSKNRKMTISRKLHDAVSFSKLSAFCKLIVPLGLPSLSTSKMSKYLRLKDQKPYHTSAIYASAIHSISLPFRMQPLGPTSQSSYTCGAMNVNELVQMLAGQARQNIVTALDVAMPAPALTGIQVQQSLLENLQSLTPEIAEYVEDVQALEAMTIHGAFASGSKRASVSEVKDAIQSAYSNALEKPRFSHLSIAQSPLPIPLPFPSIFGNLIGQNGELLDKPVLDSSTSRGSLEIHSIPMAARLRSTTAVLPFLENRLENIRKLGLARGAMGAELLRNWGFGRDDVEDLGETISNMVYQPSEEELMGFLDPYENVLCTECHQGGDDAFMLLCDLCDSPAHTYCVGLGREVPEGNWYCESCRPTALSSTNAAELLNPTPDHGANNNFSVGVSPIGIARETFDLNELYIPETPLTPSTQANNGHSPSPRNPVGDFQATSPSGFGAFTLFERRRIQRQIHQLLNDRSRQAGVGPVSGISLLSSQMTPQHAAVPVRVAPQNVYNRPSLYGNRQVLSPRLSSLREQVLHHQASTSRDQSFGEFSGNNPDAFREVSLSSLEKEQVQCMVRSHLKSLSRNSDLGMSS